MDERYLAVMVKNKVGIFMLRLIGMIATMVMMTMMVMIMMMVMMVMMAMMVRMGMMVKMVMMVCHNKSYLTILYKNKLGQLFYKRLRSVLRSGPLQSNCFFYAFPFMT